MNADRSALIRENLRLNLTIAYHSGISPSTMFSTDRGHHAHWHHHHTGGGLAIVFAALIVTS